ncbi:MAG: hypothetical protein KVP17_001586 [Porospora cf. gigantea B]|nr:MAG: hypothetical protein KVP17_001586 [Porospora cf. gigantea B]
MIARFAKNTPVLDIGCGNGMFLKRLQDLGFTQLAGFDYVADAVRLARRLLGPCAVVDQLDLTAPMQDMPMSCNRVSRLIATRWAALIHDKGTFDIFFMGNRVAEYAAALQESLLGPGVHVLITSCNATVAELQEACSFMTTVAILDYPVFTFGGVKGQVVSTVLFKHTAPQC